MTLKKKKKLSKFHYLGALIIMGLLVVGVIVSGLFGNMYEGFFASLNLNTGTTVNINTSQIIAPVNSRFQGLSFETSNLCNMVGVWDTPTFEAMFKNFGPQVIRIGGNSVEAVTWEPNGTASCSPTRTVITKQLIDSFVNLAKRLDAKIMWNVNMGSNNPALYSQEAAYLVNKAKEVGGSSGTLLLGVGIGNEPDLYVNNGKRASTYSVANYVSEWINYKNAITTALGQSDFKFMANDNCCNDKWFDGLIDSQRSSLSLISHHYYPTRSTETGIREATITNLLSPTLMQSSMRDYIDKWVAKSGNLPLAINETNTTAGGGLRGLSDTFAASLWGIDYTLTSLAHGVDYLTYHTGTSPSVYSPLQRGSSNPITGQAEETLDTTATDTDGVFAQSALNTQQLKVSSNSRYLVKNDNSNFFYMADTAWEMLHRLTREEIDTYLTKRRDQGFTAIQTVILAELSGLTVPNRYGNLPLTNKDPTKPVEAYFQHVDYAINKANELGLYLVLLPTWGDKVTGANGGEGVIFNTTNAKTFGKYLGTRYRTRTNIVWMLGGDRNPQNETEKNVWREMAAGITEGFGSNALLTYHPRGNNSASNFFQSDTWMDFSTIQSGHSAKDLPNWDLLTSGYNKTPTKPIFDSELNYEDHPINWNAANGYFRDYDVRKQSYRSVFAGGAGVTYGNQSVWQMWDVGRTSTGSPERYWTQALDRPGANQMKYLKNLMLSRPYLTRVPDQTLIASGGGSGSTLVRATRDSSGSYAMIYIPTGNQTVTINLSKLSGTTLRRWWYYPKTGLAEDKGTLAKSGNVSFTSPSGEDVILVLDDASQSFTIPGQVGGVVPTTNPTPTATVNPTATPTINPTSTPTVIPTVIPTTTPIPGAPRWVPNPLYYSMLVTDFAAPNGGNLVSTTVTSNFNIAAHSILDSTGTLRVVLVNKDQNNNASIQLNIDKIYNIVEFATLTAPSLSDTTNTVFAETKVANDGGWSSVIRKLLKRKGEVVVNVPAGSATVVVLK